MFPRSTERGPIEASARFRKPGGLRGFPRSTERGPIEARAPPVRRTGGSPFPRSTERGPIEAPVLSATLEVGHLGFHALPSVAPLKLVWTLRVACRFMDVSTLYRAWPH